MADTPKTSHAPDAAVAVNASHLQELLDEVDAVLKKLGDKAPEKLVEARDRFKL